MIRRFLRWLVVGPAPHVDKLEAATVKFEARIDAIGVETASLRHLASTLEKERDDARSELARVQSDCELIHDYGKAARAEAAAAYQHLGRLLSWTHPSHLPKTKGGTS